MILLPNRWDEFYGKVPSNILLVLYVTLPVGWQANRVRNLLHESSHTSLPSVVTLFSEKYFRERASGEKFFLSNYGSYCANVLAISLCGAMYLAENFLPLRTMDILTLGANHATQYSDFCRKIQGLTCLIHSVRETLYVTQQTNSIELTHNQPQWQFLSVAAISSSG